MKYRFEDCELDTVTGELMRAGEVCAVEPQVFDLLVYLVENRGRLVDHATLVDAIWRGRVVSDSAIAARISAARKAVGDSGRQQRIVKTVPRKGFRFIATVDSLPGATGPDAEAEPSPAKAGGGHQSVHFCRSADGTRIAYARSGEGMPLVRTGHWLTHLEHDWRSPIWRPFLDRLGRDFSVVRYDQRGCGLSDWTLNDLAFERFVEDLEAVVDACGHDRFVLYATSQGVPVAVEYALRHPHRVSHLVLLGGYAAGRLVRDDSAQVEQGEAILKLIEHGWGISGSPFLQSFSTMYIPAATHEQMESLVELQRLTTNAANAVAIRRAVDSFDVTDRLEQVSVDTLVLHAANDGVHPLSQGRDIAATIPGCEFVLLDSVNHALLPQEPAWERFFAELRRFAGC